MDDILYYDNHLLVANKAAGMLTQPNESSDVSLEALCKAWIKDHFQKPGNVFLQAVHRLDRPVSGIVVFARTSKALSRLNLSMRESRFQKEYIAWVEGIFKEKEGELEHYLLHEEHFAKIVSKECLASKKCLLKYCVQGEMDRCSLLKISLLTGRYHQIRAQLAAIGHPILGDQKYGSSLSCPNLFLHHFSCLFPHPITDEQMHFEAWMPDKWSPLLQVARK